VRSIYILIFADAKMTCYQGGMSLSTPALLAAAAGVGFGHAVLPDHWVPLAVIARTQRHPLRRVVRLSALAGVAHVGLSLLMGALLVAVGLQFRATVERHGDLVVGGLLLATGAVFLALELLGRGNPHTHTDGHGHGHGHDHEVGTGRYRRLLAFAVPFGAAASPDLTILPVFLAAGALGLVASVGTLVVFSLVTLGTIVGLTVAGTVVGFRVRGAWVDRYANMITAGALLVIGGLVVSGVV
jgi:hypothetical protein